MKKFNKDLLSKLPTAPRGELPKVSDSVRFGTKEVDVYQFLRKAVQDSPALLKTLKEALARLEQEESTASR